MDKNLNILIVEDELIIAEHISMMLVNEGYSAPLVAVSYAEAVEMIIMHKPDIVLTDISLNDDKTGIDLANYLNSNYPVPFIYITSLHTPETLRKASESKPNAYLVKPFKREDLIVSIELAMIAVRQKENEADNDNVYITVKDGYATVRIPSSEIVLLKAEENYTVINTTTQRPRIVRLFLSELQELLPSQDFVRIHRSYIINRKYISEIHRNYIVICNFQLPVSRSYSHLLQAMKQDK